MSPLLLFLSQNPDVSSLDQSECYPKTFFDGLSPPQEQQWFQNDWMNILENMKSYKNSKRRVIEHDHIAHMKRNMW
jgi:hypothetical protein